MALEEMMKKKEEMSSREDDMESDMEEGEGQASTEEDMDLRIAVLLAERLLDNGGFDVIQRAVKSSSDPAQVIGQFLMQMAQQMFEKMPKGMTLSPNILLIPGGWVEQISDYIQEEAGVDKAIMDKAEIYIASTAQKMAQTKQSQVPQGSPPGQPVPMPQQAMPQQPGRM